MTPKTQVREIDAPSRPLRMGYDFFAYGTGGILYPPGCMDARVFDIATFRALCPTEDDVWFKAMSLLRDTPVAATNLGHSPKHHSLSGSQASALRHDNYCGSVQKASVRLRLFSSISIWLTGSRISTASNIHRAMTGKIARLPFRTIRFQLQLWNNQGTWPILAAPLERFGEFAKCGNI